MTPPAADNPPTPAGGRRSVVIRSDVTLRPILPGDAPAMYRWVRDPEVAAGLGLRSEPSPERTRAWIEQATSDPTFAARAILLRDQHVGNVVLDKIDTHLSTARLSIYVGEPESRGQGVGLAATYHALGEAFGRLRLNKVWLTVHCRNVAAVSTYRALGFCLEGTLREEFVLEGQRVDLLYLGLLAADFRQFPVSPGG